MINSVMMLNFYGQEVTFAFDLCTLLNKYAVEQVVFTSSAQDNSAVHPSGVGK